MTQSQQRRTPMAWFDARSVMLFAAIAIGATAVGAQAQTTSSPPSSDQTRSGPVIGPVASPSTNSSGEQTKRSEPFSVLRERALRAADALDGY